MASEVWVAAGRGSRPWALQAIANEEEMELAKWPCASFQTDQKDKSGIYSALLKGGLFVQSIYGHMGIIFYINVCDSIEWISWECVREGAELPPSVVAVVMVLHVTTWALE